MGKEEESGPDREVDELKVVDLSDALTLIKSDASSLLKDLLRGISMWGVTAAMAFILAAVWLALGQFILAYAHPYGAPQGILDLLYASYGFAVGSVSLGAIMSWRYYSLKRRYTRLFEITRKLR